MKSLSEQTDEAYDTQTLLNAFKIHKGRLGEAHRMEQAAKRDLLKVAKKIVDAPILASISQATLDEARTILILLGDEN